MKHSAIDSWISRTTAPSDRLVWGFSRNTDNFNQLFVTPAPPRLLLAALVCLSENVDIVKR